MIDPLSETPYAIPTVTSEGVLRSGQLIAPVSVCRACVDRRCRDLFTATEVTKTRNGIGLQRCYRNVLAARVDLPGGRIVVPGVHIDAGATVQRASKSRPDSGVTVRALERWKASEEQRAPDTAKDDVRQVLHDIKSAIKPLVRNADIFVETQPGNDDDEKFTRLSPAARGLVTAARLFRYRVLSLDFIANPSAATFGRRRRRIYRVIDLFVRTLAASASSTGVTLRLYGQSHNELDVYDSFDVIPLNLLDNALKYSKRGETVSVHVGDVVATGGVRVTITSISPEIPVQDQARLFDRGFRSSNAIRVDQSGSGLGLYLAQIVAHVHETKIELNCRGPHTIVDGIEYCSNEFSFELG